MRQIYHLEANSLKQTISTPKSNFEDEIYGKAAKTSLSEQQSPTKIERFRISYQDNPGVDSKNREIHWYEITPNYRFSNTIYSNYDANDVIIVEDHQPKQGFQPRKKLLLWILVIFIMIAAIGNTAYWSVVS